MSSFYFSLLNNLLCPIVAAHSSPFRIIHRNIGNLSRVIPIKKTNFPYSEAIICPEILRKGWGLVTSLQLHARILTSMILCGLLQANGVLCSWALQPCHVQKTLCWSFPNFGSHILSLPSSLIVPLPWEGDNIDLPHMWLNTVLTFIPCTWLIVSFCTKYHILYKETSLMMLPRYTILPAERLKIRESLHTTSI